MDMNVLAAWMAATLLSTWVNAHGWIWQTAEIIHFVGLALVVGIAGVFDLRLLGFAPQIPVGALNRLMPWAVVGLVLNLITGVLFMFGAPSRYLTNPAFQWKVFFLVLAGLNVVLFMVFYSRRTLALGPHGDAPTGAKVIALTSLVSWFAVMYFGRMLPYLGDAF
jgi:hypothetical protein